MTSYSPPRSRPGGHHSAEVIKAGDRCPVQPTDGQDFTKRVSVNGSTMTFQDAQLAGFLTWQFPVPVGTERAWALWTPKAEAHNRTVHTSRCPPTPPSRAARLMTGPAYGLQRESA